MITACEAWMRWCERAGQWPEYRVWVLGRTEAEVDAERARDVRQAVPTQEPC